MVLSPAEESRRPFLARQGRLTRRAQAISLGAMAKASWTRRGATVSEQVEGLMAKSPDPSLPREQKRIFAEVLKLNPKVAADPTGTKAVKAYFDRAYDQKLEGRRPTSKKKAKKKKKK
jgi:hypothetical protein